MEFRALDAVVLALCQLLYKSVFVLNLISCQAIDGKDLKIKAG